MGLSDFEKVEQGLGLANDSNPSTMPVTTPATSFTAGQLPDVLPTIPRSVALVPKATPIACNDAMFSDVKALAIYMRENKLKLPLQWQTVALWGGIGIAVGYTLHTIINNK